VVKIKIKNLQPFLLLSEKQQAQENLIGRIP
jgi:hypothetical protein